MSSRMEASALHELFEKYRVPSPDRSDRAFQSQLLIARNLALACEDCHSELHPFIMDPQEWISSNRNQIWRCIQDDTRAPLIAGCGDPRVAQYAQVAAFGSGHGHGERFFDDLDALGGDRKKILRTHARCRYFEELSKNTGADSEMLAILYGRMAAEQYGVTHEHLPLHCLRPADTRTLLLDATCRVTDPTDADLPPMVKISVTTPPHRRWLEYFQNRTRPRIVEAAGFALRKLRDPSKSDATIVVMRDPNNRQISGQTVAIAEELQEQRYNGVKQVITLDPEGNLY